MTAAAAAAPARDVFARVLCGVDGSEHGLAAATAAARVTSPGGRLELVAVHDRAAAAPETAWEWLERAARDVPPGVRVERVALAGLPIDRLLAELRSNGATLAVVGSRNRTRTGGIVAGSVTTFLVHGAPCSVLVARGAVDSRWPRRIVAGVDGSDGSAAALALARRLAGRLGVEVEAVAAADDWRLDLARVRALAPDVRVVQDDPVHALAGAAGPADLVVVGSRGMRGLRSLSSVSERVAHEAPCSVLVVRPQRAP